MASDVLIAGVGQLGAYCLQGLASYAPSLNIWAYDISQVSLDRANELWEKCESDMHGVRFLTDFQEIPDRFDMVFVCTTADVRLSVVKTISAVASVKYWILEKVLAQRVQDLQDIVQATSNSQGVWVNTPMYIWPLYNLLRECNKGGQDIHASFTGFSGLACNAIHYIDFVSRWNYSRVCGIDTSGLNESWFPAKREGFFEITGEMKVSFSDQSTLLMAGGHEDDSYEVEIRIGDEVWKVDEVGGSANSTTGRVVAGGVLRQSDLVAPLLQQVLSTGTCRLPTLELSVNQHRILLHALGEHWKAHMKEDIGYVPIT